MINERNFFSYFLVIIQIPKSWDWNADGIESACLLIIYNSIFIITTVSEQSPFMCFECFKSPQISRVVLSALVLAESYQIVEHWANSKGSGYVEINFSKKGKTRTTFQSADWERRHLPTPVLKTVLVPPHMTPWAIWNSEHWFYFYHLANLVFEENVQSFYIWKYWYLILMNHPSINY